MWSVVSVERRKEGDKTRQDLDLDGAKTHCTTWAPAPAPDWKALGLTVGYKVAEALMKPIVAAPAIRCSCYHLNCLPPRSQDSPHSSQLPSPSNRGHRRCPEGPHRNEEMALLLAIITYAFSLFASISHGNAYIIDSSCHGSIDNLNAVIKSTFSLVSAAQSLLYLNPVRELQAHGKQVYDAKIDAIKFIMPEILTNGQPDTANSYWRHADKVLEHVLLLGKPFRRDSSSAQETSSSKRRKLEHPQDPGARSNKPADQPDWGIYRDADPNEVVIFCNQNHFTRHMTCAGKPSATLSCDRTIQLDFHEDLIKYDECQYDSKNNPLKVLAYARTFDKFLAKSPWANHIILCAKTMEKIERSEIDEESKRDALPTREENGEATYAANPAIDMATSPASTLFHELTHVVDKKYRTEHGYFEDGGYRWHGIRKAVLERLSNRNADSYVYLGLAARLISPPSPGRKLLKILRDGNFAVVKAAKGKHKGGKRKKRAKVSRPRKKAWEG
ncbi:uncharacterized protein UV8b_05760 [Ustilaginoidea virens]|uniref:Lysine-specific metallo-endopeptidase domain-containing protein n=2 Tax=Ustilaginoidea virens TaxID=1159556 RepID=A0A8E5MJE0_USTVR|nr:uncharacterized protein UV8b_05760 [Ustilaginoidea virens]QUC21517.1 hypothetical protein UV8b_05760 [Ustilaginoidea virens]